MNRLNVSLRAFRTPLALLALLCAGPVFLARAADLPGVVVYRGIHPLFPHTGRFCYIDVAHVHGKRPSDLRVYRVLSNEEYLFVGDPVALGYVGPTHAYFGPHPLVLDGAPAFPQIFCYLRGPHFHAQESTPLEPFVSKAGVYWFTGSFPPEFDRDRRYLWINDSGVIASYRPPTVTLADAPDGYRFPPEARVQPIAEVPASAPMLAKGRAKGLEGRAKSGTHSTVKSEPR
jgi:hypothetical protein